MAVGVRAVGEDRRVGKPLPQRADGDPLLALLGDDEEAEEEAVSYIQISSSWSTNFSSFRASGRAIPKKAKKGLCASPLLGVAPHHRTVRARDAEARRMQATQNAAGTSRGTGATKA